MQGGREGDVRRAVRRAVLFVTATKHPDDLPDTAPIPDTKVVCMEGAMVPLDCGACGRTISPNTPYQMLYEMGHGALSRAHAVCKDMEACR